MQQVFTQVGSQPECLKLLDSQNINIWVSEYDESRSMQQMLTEVVYHLEVFEVARYSKTIIDASGIH
jgi:hypothetical protein